MEKKEPYIVAWSDEDGMRYEKFPSLEKAQGKLCSLFEEQAGEEYSDDGLGYYVEEWEPELKDPDSDEDEFQEEEALPSETGDETVRRRCGPD